MSSHSIAETKNSLSELVVRAERGEEIVITRHGQPVAKLTGVQPKPYRISKEDVEWLQKHRVKGKIPEEDAGTFVSRLRDEEWPR